MVPSVAVVDSGGAKLGLAMSLEVLPGAGDGGSLVVAAGYESGHVAVVDVAARATLVVIRAFSEPAVSVAVTAGDGGRWSVIAASADGKVQCYSGGGGGGEGKAPEPAAQQWELAVPQGVGAMRVRPDGRLLALGGWDHALRLLDARTGKMLATAPHGDAMVAVRVEPRGAAAAGGRTSIAAGCSDSSIALWETDV